MTPLSETALAFARECMGWKDAVYPGAPLQVICSQDDGGANGIYFDYRDLLIVIEKARKCCGHLKIESQDVKPSWYVEAWLNAEKMEKGWLKGQARENDLCKALMSACVEATRKLREAT